MELKPKSVGVAPPFLVLVQTKPICHLCFYERNLAPPFFSDLCAKESCSVPLFWLSQIAPPLKVLRAVRTTGEQFALELKESSW